MEVLCIHIREALHSRRGSTSYGLVIPISHHGGLPYNMGLRVNGCIHGKTLLVNAGKLDTVGKEHRKSNDFLSSGSRGPVNLVQL